MRKENLHLHCDADDVKYAHAVASSVVIQSVEPVYVSVDSDLRSGKVPPDLVGIVRHDTGHWSLDDGVLRVLVSAEVRFVRESDINNESIATIALTYALTYAAPPKPVPEDIRERGIPAFARTTALVGAWPYLRQEVNHFTAQLGIPFVMPLLVAVPPKKFEEKAE